MLRFGAFGRVLGRAWAFRAIVGGFRAVHGVGELAAALPLPSRSARGRAPRYSDGFEAGGFPFFAIPLPYDILFCARAVLLNQSNIRK